MATLFDRVAPDLLRLALHLGNGPADAEDLLQQTFLTAMQSSETFDPQQKTTLAGSGGDTLPALALAEAAELQEPVAQGISASEATAAPKRGRMRASFTVSPRTSIRSLILSVCM